MSDLDFSEVLSIKRLRKGIEAIKMANLATKRLDGWFLLQEIKMNKLKELVKSKREYSKSQIQAELLEVNFSFSGKSNNSSFLFKPSGFEHQ